MAQDCVFCKIASGDMGTKFVHEDDVSVAFHDLNPQAPTHVLVIPKRHIERPDAATAGDVDLLGRLLLAASKVAKQLGIAESGFRMVINAGRHGGQTVSHLHVHLLGGRPMRWPPG